MSNSQRLDTTQTPEMLGRFLNLNKIKTKRLSNHMSQYLFSFQSLKDARGQLIELSCFLFTSVCRGIAEVIVEAAIK